MGRKAKLRVKGSIKSEEKISENKDIWREIMALFLSTVLLLLFFLVICCTSIFNKSIFLLLDRTIYCAITTSKRHQSFGGNLILQACNNIQSMQGFNSKANGFALQNDKTNLQYQFGLQQSKRPYYGSLQWFLSRYIQCVGTSHPSWND